MKVYIELITTFFKIGAFSFGGGYAMIPLIQTEIEKHGWMSATEFIDIIAIAEMTPGPIAVNSATFVGYKSAGLLGGVIATIGVALPSLLLILLVSQVFFKYQNHPTNKMIFYGIRPVIVGLISTAAITVSKTAFLKADYLESYAKSAIHTLNMGSIGIFAIAFTLMWKLNLHPILTIVICGVLGVIIF